MKTKSSYYPDMEAIPGALTANTVGPISIKDLAELMGVPVEKLRPVVEHNYLRIVIPSAELERTIVSRPGQRALDWLKAMFQPFEMRPLIPLREVGKLWDITEHEIIKWCKAYRIPIYSDLALGNLMSFRAVKSYARVRMKYHKPKPLDRAGFLRWYLSQIWGERWRDPPPFSVRLEKEINRIVHLPQPQRTLRSLALIEAFHDARTVTECIRRERQISAEILRCEAAIEELRKKVLTQEWRSKARRDAEMESMEELGIERNLD